MIDFVSNGNGTTTARVDGENFAGITPPPVKGDQFLIELTDESADPRTFYADTLPKARALIGKIVKKEMPVTSESTQQSSESASSVYGNQSAAPGKQTSRSRSAGTRAADAAIKSERSARSKRNAQSVKSLGTNKNDAMIATQDEIVREGRAQSGRQAVKNHRVLAASKQTSKNVPAKSAAALVSDADRKLCIADGCTNVARKNNSFQLCLKHDRERRAAKRNVPCSVALCTSAAAVKGLCGPHYNASLAKRKSAAA